MQLRLVSLHRSVLAFTLMELAIVLGVVGVFLGGIWGVAETMYRAYKVDLTVRQIHQIIQNMREAYVGVQIPQNWTTDGQDITNSLYQKNLIPKEMKLVSNGLFYHSMSGVNLSNTVGSFQIQASSPATGAFYNIYLYGLAQKDCIKLATKLSFDNHLSGLNGAVQLIGQGSPPLGGDVVDFWNARCSDTAANNKIIIPLKLHG